MTRAARKGVVCLAVTTLILGLAPAVAARADVRTQHAPVAVHISKTVKLGRFSEALVSVWVRCSPRFVAPQLTIDVSQQGLAGSVAGDFGIVCDGQGHRIDTSVTTPGGGEFAPGITTVDATLDVTNRRTGNPRRATDSITVFVHSQAEVKIVSREVRLGQRGVMLVPVIVRCESPWVVQELVVDVSQSGGGLFGQVAGDFGIVCDDRRHRLDLQIFSSGDDFGPGSTTINAFFDVLDPIDFDPVDQGRDSVTVFVKPPSDVQIAHVARLNPDGTVTVTLFARCLPPWRVGDLTMDISQGANGDTRTNDHFFACDGHVHRFELKAFGTPGPFHLGPADVQAFFTVLDPVSFDPVFQAQDTETVDVLPAQGPPILYDQSGSGAGAIISSDTVNDIYDSQGADDFVVPDGEVWSIEAVNAPGAFGGPNAVVPGVNVFLYEDDGTLPGGLIASYLDLPTSSGPDDLTVALTPPLTLEPGTYWISVQADLSSLPEGNSWLWAYRTFDLNDTGVWQQPGDGAGTGDITWTPFHDFEFTLRGTTTAGPPGSSLRGRVT